LNVGVIGAGIFGITAALELRSRQHEITVFEQGKIPQQDASSTDVSKSIRRDGYGPTYFELVERAAAKWKMWHEQLSKAIYYQTGKFRIARNFEPGTQAYEGWQFLTDRGAKIQLLSRQEARERFPQFTYYEEDTCFFYDPWAGYLRSGQAVEDLAGLARDEDVQIHEETGITQLKEGTSGVQVFFEGGSAQFDRVVIATGVWMNRLVPQIGKHMSLTRQEMAFF
jgi:glycine/D-amino acid oxidase-like deaminating enzyme